MPKKMMIVNNVPSRKADTPLVVLNYDSNGAEIETLVLSVSLAVISSPRLSIPYSMLLYVLI